jgi:hypothetical protein
MSEFWGAHAPCVQMPVRLGLAAPRRNGLLPCFEIEKEKSFTIARA